MTPLREDLRLREGLWFLHIVEDTVMASLYVLSLLPGSTEQIMLHGKG